MLHAPARLDGILVFDTGSGQLSPELSQLNLPGLFFAAQYSVTGQHEFFGYFFGTAILANVVLGYVAEMAGWDWTFILLLIACALSIILMSFTYKDEKALLAERNKK